jgi:hypothetical protein
MSACGLVPRSWPLGSNHVCTPILEVDRPAMQTAGSRLGSAGQLSPDGDMSWRRNEEE